ncbi:MAG: GGDEF domain-containing protein [Clostridia bacterium]|nr:GGDEF domain-containing protein [Clostridia bacterium]
MDNFAFYYIESNIVCIIVFGILLIHSLSIDRQEKQIQFDYVLVAFMLYFASDSFWAAIIGGLVPKTNFTVFLDVFLIYIFMAASIYFWLGFVMAFEQVPHRNRQINRFAVIFPFLVTTAALILNFLIAPQMLIDDTLEIQSAFTVYLITVPCIYMVAILFYALRKARSEENPHLKRKHLFIGFFPLLSLIGGLVQVAFPYIPIYCFMCLILMLVFYIQSILGKVSIDPLTRLNNRGQLMRYTSQKSNVHIENRLTVVIMMDIDEFKSINDTYGHAEGDKALVAIADSLKTVINRHSMPSFLCRYGGDEFILIVHPEKKEEVDRLIDEIREEVKLKEMPYRLAVSAGYDELMGNQDSLENCIERADKKLYLDKEYRKLHPSRA